MFADSTTNTAMCRCSLLFWFFLPLCRYHLTAVLRSICTAFSPADEATTSKRQLDPLPSQLSRKTEQKKKKKNTQRRDSHTGTSVIHQHDQDFRTINHHGHHAKCRPQKQHILRADEYVKKCLVCWKERLHAARTFSRSRNPMGGTPYLQMWSWMLHRVNGSNRELEQNPTRHSWFFSKITPDDWR